MSIVAVLRPSLTACRKETQASLPLTLNDRYRLEGSTLADRLAASLNYKHPWLLVWLHKGDKHKSMQQGLLQFAIRIILSNHVQAKPRIWHGLELRMFKDPVYANPIWIVSPITAYY